MRLVSGAHAPAGGRACTVLLALLAVLAACVSPAAAEVGGGATVAGQAGAAKIASSVLGSCAITPQSTVRCWGEGDSGQLATGNEDNVGNTAGSTTVQVFLGRGVVPAQLSSGYAHTCAVDTTGGVWCWGRDINGQAGDLSTGEYLGDDEGERPARVPLPPGFVAAQVAAGREHTCALSTAGAVACWGDNTVAQLGGEAVGGVRVVPQLVTLPSAAFSISTRDSHTCVLLTPSRELRCWGANSWGQTGLPNGLGSAPVAGPRKPTAAPGQFLAVSTGRTFTCGIAAPNRNVLCWGEGTQGQLADGKGKSTTEPGSTAYPINLGGAKATAISTGSDTACVLTDAGAVRCWGSNDSGMLGGGFVGNNWGDSGDVGGPERVPITVALGAGRTAVGLGVGGRHTCAMLSTGAPLCWGDGDSGQRANGMAGESGKTTPSALPPVVFAADLPDGDADGLPDRYDVCPAAAGAADDGCPPPAQPAPQQPAPVQPVTPKPPTVQPPVIVEPKPRTLKVSVLLKRKSGVTSCPKSGTASVVGAKPKFSGTVKIKKRKLASGKVRCAATATISWPDAPSAGTKVKVKVGGKGLTSRTITVKVTA